jgi:hypothetical protein
VRKEHRVFRRAGDAPLRGRASADGVTCALGADSRSSCLAGCRGSPSGGSTRPSQVRSQDLDRQRWGFVRELAPGNALCGTWPVTDEKSTYRDLTLVHGFFFRRRTSAARAGCCFRTGRARLRKLLRNASTPRSNPPLGPDGPNAPECSRVAYPCRKAQVATAAGVSSGCPETPLVASSSRFHTALPAPNPYLSGWRFCMTNS